MAGERISAFHAWRSDSSTAVRLLLGLPGLLRRAIDGVHAREVVRRRLASRDQSFLDVARREILGRPAGVYARLLMAGGWSWHDLELAVRRRGLEETLCALREDGVFVRADELRGRIPLERRGERFEVDLAALRPAGAARPDLAVRSSGSRGRAAEGAIALAAVRDQAFDLTAALAADGGTWRAGVWMVPGSVVLVRATDLHLATGQPVQLFLQVDPLEAGLHHRYRWSLRLLRWAALAAGRPLPAFRHASVDDPAPVLRWVREVLDGGERPLLWTQPSAAIELARAAVDAGADLSGLRLSLGGEASTAARMNTIRRSGAEAFPHYASMETGLIGIGCRRPRHSDHLHLLDDLHATVPDPESGELLFTSLRPDCRFFLLNASLGDLAELDSDPCGCILEELGWRRKVHTVRSRSRVTAGGMTFPHTTIARALETILPSRFGGVATDYQLVENSGPDGAPRLRLLVDPRVGPIEPEELERAFLEAIGEGDGLDRVMSLHWRSGGWVGVERRPPLRTGTGKRHPVHRLDHVPQREASDGGDASAATASPPSVQPVSGSQPSSAKSSSSD
ncbi:MAG TPA: hypothetical protein VMT85_25570 [Thermoanaerobaculia bacterium]|nr:hypothetical protein [Thermoanaerobaculia bacterium]